jgi:hypothetical protein
MGSQQMNTFSSAHKRRYDALAIEAERAARTDPARRDFWLNRAGIHRAWIQHYDSITDPIKRRALDFAAEKAVDDVTKAEFCKCDRHTCSCSTRLDGAAPVSARDKMIERRRAMCVVPGTARLDASDIDPTSSPYQRAVARKRALCAPPPAKRFDSDDAPAPRALESRTAAPPKKSLRDAMLERRRNACQIPK